MMIKKSRENVGILGYGQVGQAIAKFYQSPKIKDLDRDDGLEGINILHICVPYYDDKFVKIVKREIGRIKPKLTIIHSTVAPGTTKKIALSLPKEIGERVVHSPVRGTHPHLYESIRTFVKYIGTDNRMAGELARKHLESLGIKTKVFQPSLTTELGKLLGTSYYGLCIAWHGEMKRLCQKFKVEFEKVATDFNQTYNEGYIKLGRKNVVRPVLYPPQPFIGGHCVIPNTKILKKYFKSPALDLILRYSPGKK